MDASDTVIPMSIPETERIAPELRTIPFLVKYGTAEFSRMLPCINAVSITGAYP